MRMMSIASGSSGNCIYIGTDSTHVLVDDGISRKKVLEGLPNERREESNMDPDSDSSGSCGRHPGTFRMHGHCRKSADGKSAASDGI